MKKAFANRQVLILFCVICVALAGAWAIHRWNSPAVIHTIAGTSNGTSGTNRPTAINSPTAINEPGLPEVRQSARRSSADQSIKRWTDAVRQAPRDDQLWVNLGDAYMQKARETLDLSYYGLAERAYQKSLDLNSQKVPAMIGLAWVNSGRHEFETSVQWAKKALAIDPKCQDAYGLIGDADMEFGSYDDAFQQYQKMIDIRPDLSSYSRGAYLLWIAGDTRKAAWLMAKAIGAGAPYGENTAWCRWNLARMMFNQGSPPAAEQVLKMALKESPNNYRILDALGMVKAAEKDYPAAIDFYQKAIAVAPQFSSVVALGDIYSVTGQEAKAEQQYALAETIDKLGKANGVRGGWQMALFMADHNRDLPAALKLAQEEYKTRKNVYAADTLAWCLYKNGQYKEADSMIRSALSKRTPEALFLFHAGIISAKLGDRPTAQLCLYRAVSQNPNFSPVASPMAYAMLKELGSRPPDSRPAAAH